MKKFFVIFLTLLLTLTMVCGLAEIEPTVCTSGDYRYILLEDGTAEIVGYNGYEQELIVPNDLDGHRVTSIGDRAFYRCDFLISVTLPDSIAFIGKSAFYQCNSMSTINIPNGVTTIDDGAFVRCHSLVTLSLPDTVVIIGKAPFSPCGSLASIDVSPEHPTLTVVEGALYEKATNTLIWYPCGSKADTYVVPEGTCIIGDSTFADCYSLVSIQLPNSITVIGENAFIRCAALTSINLPSNVTSIGKDAFFRCSSLKVITVTPGSYAEEWALSNGYEVTYTEPSE